MGPLETVGAYVVKFIQKLQVKIDFSTFYVSKLTVLRMR